jgi:DnaK suppressor protein
MGRFGGRPPEGSSGRLRHLLEARYGSRMDDDHARMLLQRERERIALALARLGAEAPGAFADQDQPGELGSEALYQSEFDAGVADDLRAQLAAVERAEARLEAGTYGYSVESGVRIPDDRLEAVPAAERTLEEQRQHDHR